jgi:LPS export ABC transporter protein LptC
MKTALHTMEMVLNTTNARRKMRTVRVPAVAVLAIAAGLAGCDREMTTPVADASTQSMEADYVAFGMLSYITANGVREGRVQADTSYIYEETSTALLKQMTIVFYDEYGAERATVTGTDGEWTQSTNRMVARGDVVLLIHSDSSRIESQEIYYDQAIDKVWSDSTTVRTMKDGSVFSGTAFESDMTFENLSIRSMRGGLPRSRE